MRVREREITLFLRVPVSHCLQCPKRTPLSSPREPGSVSPQDGGTTAAASHQAETAQAVHKHTHTHTHTHRNVTITTISDMHDFTTLFNYSQIKRR